MGQQQFFAYNDDRRRRRTLAGRAPPTTMSVRSACWANTPSAQNVRQTVAPFQQALLRNTRLAGGRGVKADGEDPRRSLA